MAKAKPQTDPLKKWLSLDWTRPERSYNPDVRDFLANLLDYPKDQVVTEDSTIGGYPDIKLLTDEKIAWVVGDLKKNDAELTTEKGRRHLWQEKRKYIEGLTRYALFLTPHYLWVVFPNGEAVNGFENPVDLAQITLENLSEKLGFLAYGRANHLSQWETFITGELPYVYLHLDNPISLKQLQNELQNSFSELTEAADTALVNLLAKKIASEGQIKDIERNLVGRGETQIRALMQVRNQFSFERHLFDEVIPQFEEQYGREVAAQSDKQVQERIREAFVADSVAVLIARVLFLRLLEDLALVSQRRLSNGGLKKWSEFVEYLKNNARALIQLVSKDIGQFYQQPFQQSLFDWLYEINGDLEQALQRLIMRSNAYDFSGLSEEILGDIYQTFLPTAKRKRLGEFYTPTSMVDWLLEQTIFSHEPGKLLDPACGSGSFLVRYVHRVLEDSKHRRLTVDDVLHGLQSDVWGFDLNPFAAFISHFQLTWALLRYNPEKISMTVNVYNINSILDDRDLLGILGEMYLAPGIVERDNHQWKYIVGNPPYIRAERVKYSKVIQKRWQSVWGQNADTGLIFLYRALTESLETGGFLGMVVSGGYANSEAAAKVWKLLYPGREAALRKVIWLEFAGKLWDANVIPMLLIIEKVPAQENDDIELYVPSAWPSKEKATKIKYKDFFDSKISPRVTPIDPSNTSEGRWGDYLLPLLHRQDIKILKKLYPNENNGKKSNIVSLKEAVAPQVSRNNRPFWFTYGIQRGGVEITSEPTGENCIQVIAGRSISIGHCEAPLGWVNLDEVQERPYGKLSIWMNPNHSKLIAVTNIGFTPTAAVIDSNLIACIDTLIVALPKSDGGHSLQSIAAYLNSKLARFYYLKRLRSGVLEGSSRAHVYPRTLEALPWVKTLDSAIEQKLTDHYNELARLAAIAKDNPGEWLLSEVQTRIEQKRYKLSDSHLGLNFVNWSPEDVMISELILDNQFIRSGVFWIEFINSDLAELVFKLLTLTLEEENKVSRSIIQKLIIPPDYPSLMSQYRQKLQEFERIEADFLTVLAKIDQAVYQMFELTEIEKQHIEERLGSFPLNKLQPRYPWQTVKPRSIKAYTSDRFL